MQLPKIKLCIQDNCIESALNVNICLFRSEIIQIVRRVNKIGEHTRAWHIVESQRKSREEKNFNNKNSKYDQ